MTIGDRIRRIRKKRRLTQAELAMMSGLSLSAIQGYEQGRYEPKRKSLESIAEVFKIPVDELYDTPAQHGTNLAEVGTDCISRQAATDAIEKKSDEIYKTKQDGATFPHDDLFQGMAYAEDVVKRLPSAQPEPCEDAVSRVGAISHFRAIADATYPKEKYNEGFVDGLEFCIAHLSTMPSVTPKQRTGKWIDVDVMGMPAQACDQCKTFFPLAYTGGGHHYCPNCGADMRGEQNG